MRSGGNLGTVNVSWYATTNNNSNGAEVESDLESDYGVVTFDIGQINGVLSVLISPDDVSIYRRLFIRLKCKVF